MPLIPPADELLPYLNAILIGSGVALSLLWLAVALWSARDARARSRAWWAPVLTFLFVLLVPIIGLVIYLLLRPRETLAARYDRALEQEALLQGIEERQACPGCSRSVDPRWMVCPRCHTRLHEPCRHCGSPLETGWDICPFCASLVEQPEPVATDALAATAPIANTADVENRRHADEPLLPDEAHEASPAAETGTRSTRRRRSELG